LYIVREAFEGCCTVCKYLFLFIVKHLPFDLAQTWSIHRTKVFVVQRLAQTFNQMDKNQDGLLDIAEFRAAMDALGDHLDGPMVAEVCDAMNAHGSITFEQFEDILAAEAVRARTPEAARLRALLHDRSADHFKDWLSTWA
jgi:hypothetical protein